MKLEIRTDVLKSGIAKIQHCLKDKSDQNPVLEHFLFEIKNKTLVIKATDTILTAIWFTAVDTEDTFSFSILGKSLVPLISSLDGEKVTLEFNLDTKGIKLTCSNYEWESSSGLIEDFPNIEIPLSLKEINLPNNFVTMLKSVFFSIHNKTDKVDLNSLCMDLNKDNSGNLSLISTDRARLSCAIYPITETEILRFVIPKASISEIIRLHPTVMLYSKDIKKIYFKTQDEFGTTIFQSLLNNALYPDIYGYLTKGFEDVKTTSVKKDDFIKVLKRIKLASDEEKRSALIDIQSDKMIFSAVSSRSKAKEILEVTGTETFKFDGNIDYLLEYLTLETSEQVAFKVVGKKCLIFDKENYRHVLSIKEA